MDNNGLWGIRFEDNCWTLYNGYDGYTYIDKEYYEDHPNANEDLRKIADGMIERWTEFRKTL